MKNIYRYLCRAFLYFSALFLFLNTCYGQLGFCSFCSTSAFCSVQKQVGYNTPASPLNKPGWNLVFNDEFEGVILDPVKWNKSTNLDDGYHNCVHDIVLNPNNIWVTGGNLKLGLTTTNYAGCSNSGAEVKTYSTQDPNFRTIQFYPNSYIEVRVKDLPFSDGAGSAFWLWHPGIEYREIDIWETYSHEENMIKTNYHWDVAGNPNVSESERIRLWKELYITPLNVDDGWVNIGCEWHENRIDFYLNNTLIRSIDLTGENSDGVQYDPANQPLTIKLGVQSPLQAASCPDPLDESALPTYMYIDYVRVYKQSATQACALTSNSEFCPADGGFLVDCPYYPNAVYNWDNASPCFNYGPTDANVDNQRWVTLKTGVASNQYCDVKVTVTFPSGYVETDTKSVYISSTPAVPTGSISTLRQGTSCFYWAKIVRPSPDVNILWSENGGATWHNGTNYTSGGVYWSKFGEYDGPATYTVKVKAENTCGTSAASPSKSFSVPSHPVGCWLKEADSSYADIENNFQNGNIIFYENVLTFGDLLSHHAEPFYLQVYNIQGEKILECRVVSEINIGNLSSGVYTAIVRDDHLAVVDKLKFVKQ